MTDALDAAVQEIEQVLNDEDALPTSKDPLRRARAYLEDARGDLEQLQELAELPLSKQKALAQYGRVVEILRDKLPMDTAFDPVQASGHLIELLASKDERIRELADLPPGAVEPVAYQMYRSQGQHRDKRAIYYRHYVTMDDGTLWRLVEINPEGDGPYEVGRWRRVGRPVPGSPRHRALTDQEQPE